jgi:hypothetical protein
MAQEARAAKTLGVYGKHPRAWQAGAQLPLNSKRGRGFVRVQLCIFAVASHRAHFGSTLETFGSVFGDGFGFSEGLLGRMFGSFANLLNIDQISRPPGSKLILYQVFS